MAQPLEVIPSSAAICAGVARRDITPPIGIYSRMWGAATHDTAEGVHRPITATVLAMQSASGGPPLLLVSLDFCHIPEEVDLQMFRQPLVDLADGDEARVILACTHTHSVGFVSSQRIDLPGGHLIRPYLQSTRDAIADAAKQAVEQSATMPCTLTFATGRCTLAINRDQPDPAPGSNRYVCGFNLDIDADDTMLVGRVTRNDDDAVLATIVNYACHPTSLTWGNRLHSPDYVGALREVVEDETAGAPCVFLQGAAGDLTPPYLHPSDPALADRFGRQAGHAAASTLYSMLPPRQKLAYQGVVESGAPLGIWEPAPFDPPTTVDASILEVDLPLKDLPSVEELEAQLAEQTDRALAERLRRKIGLIKSLGDGPTVKERVWCWRIGRSIWRANRNEAYSRFQQTLRASAGDDAVIIIGVANGACGYLYPAELGDKNVYQVWQSPFAPGALEQLTEACMQR